MYSVEEEALPDGSDQAVLASILELAGCRHEALGPELLLDQLLHLLPQALLTALVPAPTPPRSSASQSKGWHYNVPKAQTGQPQAASGNRGSRYSAVRLFLFFSTERPGSCAGVPKGGAASNWRTGTCQAHQLTAHVISEAVFFEGGRVQF